jgi:hypothetical protein
MKQRLWRSVQVGSPVAARLRAFADEAAGDGCAEAAKTELAAPCALLAQQIKAEVKKLHKRRQDVDVEIGAWCRSWLFSMLIHSHSAGKKRDALDATNKEYSDASSRARQAAVKVLQQLLSCVC